MEPKGTSMIKLDYLHGFNDGSCGYCHDKKGSSTCGFSASSLSLRDYYDMMDRGWRRCGDYYYKPNVAKNCCKLFTIRLDVTKYEMRKSHKRALKKWNKFLAGEDVKNEPEESKEKEEKEKVHPVDQELDLNTRAKEKAKANTLDTEEAQANQELLQKALGDFLDFIKTNKGRLAQTLSWSEEEILQVSEKTEKEMKIMKGNSKKFGDFTTNLLMLLFADNRVRLGQGGVKNVSDFVGKIKDLTLEGFAPLVGNMKVNIQDNGYVGFGITKENDPVKEVTAPGNIRKKKGMAIEDQGTGDKKPESMNPEDGEKMALEETKDQATNEVRKTHEKVRKDLTAKIVEEVPATKKGRKLEIRFEKAKFEKESFEMYQRYCKDIHEKEKEDAEGYKRFLCVQAVEFDKLESGGKVLQLGCYHMKYYVDDKFIAVGVVDLFPNCLSSVYFFYEPEYKHLSLGVIGALKEIEYVQEMRPFFPEFKYYYLGYYVQNCQKMVYKGEYEPAELLCPFTYTWVTLDENLRKRIDKGETKISDKNAKTPEDMDFSATNVEKFVKDKVKLYINGPIRIIQLNKQYQPHYIGAFKDLVMTLGRRLSTSFVYGYDK